MNKILKFYDYDRALASFKDALLHIHQAPVKRSGIKIIAKPVLLLSILQGIEKGRITTNRFDYNQVKPYYESLFRKYFIRARQERLTLMYYPWYFMHHDGFWHLSWQGHEPIETECVSESFIMRNTTHACFDNDLWTLVSHPYYRQELIQFIIDKKIIAPLSSGSHEFAADGGLTLKNLLALLVAI